VLTPQAAQQGDAPTYELVYEAAVAGADMGANEAIYNASLFDIELVFNQATSRSVDKLVQAAQSAPDGTTITTHIESPSALLRVVEAAGSDTIVLNAGAHADRLRGASCHPRLFHVTPSHAQHATALAMWMASQDLSAITVLAASTGDPDAQTAKAILTEQGVDVADMHTQDTLPDDAERLWVTPTAARPSTLHSFLEADIQLFCPVPPPGVSTRNGASIPTTAASRVHSAVQWHPSLFKYGATQVTDRFQSQWDLPMDGVAYANWLAMQIAGDAIAQTGEAGPALRTHLRTATRFDGRKSAPISFRPWNQQARHELYIQTPDADSPLATSIPERMPDDPAAQIKVLDALGQTRGACSLD
jgi:ABC-type branched-subunit amino acid transport system substrate-binding protein